MDGSGTITEKITSPPPPLSLGSQDLKRRCHKDLRLGRSRREEGGGDGEIRELGCLPSFPFSVGRTTTLSYIFLGQRKGENFLFSSWRFIAAGLSKLRGRPPFLIFFRLPVSRFVTAPIDRKREKTFLFPFPRRHFSHFHFPCFWEHQSDVFSRQFQANELCGMTGRGEEGPFLWIGWEVRKRRRKIRHSRPLGPFTSWINTTTTAKQKGRGSGKKEAAYHREKLRSTCRRGKMEQGPSIKHEGRPGQCIKTGKKSFFSDSPPQRWWN